MRAGRLLNPRELSKELLARGLVVNGTSSAASLFTIQEGLFYGSAKVKGEMRLWCYFNRKMYARTTMHRTRRSLILACERAAKKFKNVKEAPKGFKVDE